LLEKKQAQGILAVDMHVVRDAAGLCPRQLDMFKAGRKHLVESVLAGQNTSRHQNHVDAPTCNRPDCGPASPLTDSAVNPISLQSVNRLLTFFYQEGNPMVIYPVPAELTQARIQLLVDQTAKAPQKTINEDLKAVYETTAQAEQSALVDVKV
jgi:hypothetical protein